jgi:putative transposase
MVTAIQACSKWLELQCRTWSTCSCRFIERLWRSLKYEEVYLKGYADGREAHAGIAGWMGFYNGFRPHQALAGRTPMAVWREGVTGTLAANAVDMTLRLDDARASPTCPPR